MHVTKLTEAFPYCICDIHEPRKKRAIRTCLYVPLADYEKKKLLHFKLQQTIRKQPRKGHFRKVHPLEKQMKKQSKTTSGHQQK